MPVMIGVDPHKASHTAAALDEQGQLLGQQRIAATLDGYQTLRVWAERWPDRRWAVEGAHGLGRALVVLFGSSCVIRILVAAHLAGER